jgi:hypothetical protein
MAIDSMGAMEEKVPGIYVSYPWWFRCKGHKKQGELSDKFIWTLTHSYYANMGGFRLCCKSDGRDTADALTAAELASRWANIEMPQISEEEIKDKSKADFSQRQ